jgi:hypothetical protein
VADALKNFAKVNVSTGYSAAATSVALSSGEGTKLPQPSTDGEFNLVWYNSTDYPDPADDPNVEIVRVTARSTDTLTVTRAQESTSASTKNTAAKTYKMVLGPTKKTVDDLFAALSVQTITGTLNGANTTFTIPNTYTGKSIIALNGMILVQDAHYTVSSTTITYLSAPPDFTGQTISHVLICLR